MSVEITDAEYQIMLMLWDKHPATAKNILQRLDTSWHPKTVNTLLSRLVKKQAINYLKDGRQYLYSPLLQKSDYIQHKSKDFVQKLYGGQLSPLVAHFVDQRLVEKDDMEALKKLIDEWEKDSD